MKSPSKSIAVYVVAAILAAGVLFLSSCGPNGGEKIVYTGANISQSEISAKLGYSFVVDKYAAITYETVDYDWLIKSYHDIFWARMFNEGITKWDSRANCTIFTEEYIGILQKMYYRDHFHSSSKSERLAIGEFWYYPDLNNPEAAHSVVIAITNRGVVYIEPQSRERPTILTLSDSQINARILRKF